MADNTIIIGGATQPSTINTPGDKRERVTTFKEIYAIDNPAIGGTIWVEDEQREYRIISLKPKMIGGVEIENAAIGEVVPESAIISREITTDAQSIQDLAEAIASNEEAIGTISHTIAQNTEYNKETGELTLL